jgi:hypothetical protein
MALDAAARGTRTVPHDRWPGCKIGHRTRRMMHLGCRNRWKMHARAERIRVGLIIIGAIAGAALRRPA